MIQFDLRIVFQGGWRKNHQLVFETSGFQGVTCGNGQLGLDFMSLTPQSWKLKLLGKSEPKKPSLKMVVQNGDFTMAESKKSP